MTTIAIHASHPHFDEEEHERLISHRVTRYFVPVGRVLFAGIFLPTVVTHFSSQAIGYAASQGVPLANLLVPASGVLALLGGLSLAFGYKARFGAFLLVLFLVPVTLMMHRFWSVSDPMQHMMQQAMFMKNVSMCGAALVFTHFGAGPISIDAQLYKRASANEQLRFAA